jgi:hypothetical protein
MKTENIQQFLRTAYTYEGLVALLAHAEDGKLSFTSCTCLIGSVNPGHALMAAGEYCAGSHLEESRKIEFAEAAEEEFKQLGDPGDGLTPWSDELRRERIIPLICTEILRRESAQSTANILDTAEPVEVA